MARWLRAAHLQGLLNASTAGLDAFAMALGIPLLSAEVGAVRLRGFARHRSFLEHLASGTYEPYTLDLFRSAIRPGSLVVDGGAHIGLFSVVACALLRGQGTLIAVEADPYNIRALQFNLRQCGCTNARVIRAAVWRTEGEAPFFVSRGTIGSSLAVRPDFGMVRATRARTVSIDGLTREVVAPEIVVKLDVEGAEVEALEGMEALLREARQVVLLVEVNPGAQAQAGHSDTLLIAALRAQGLRVEFVDEPGRQLVEIGEHAPRKGMLLCRRSKGM